ncbi:MAG TPA: phosphoribosylformylglycinamidine synthase subunit PurS [Candidatus Methylacidiphilales bacterium]|nr:phosphoribosylformylglycinamidine synthase subunit PurS [Candidatus Methylacidiphilales bacterium]
MIRAQVIVRPRASIFDPQGDAVQRAIQHLGFSAIKQAHVGKFIELELDANDASTVRAQLESICKDLLSNPVIEDYALTFEASAPVLAKKPAKPSKSAKKNKTPATKPKTAAFKPVKKAKAPKTGKAAKPRSAKISRTKKARKK